MTDFIDAFNGGLKAAEAAGRARREIDDVFSNLDKQIRKGSDGKLSIEKSEFEIQSWRSVITIPPRPKKTYWAITAINPTIKESHESELARWQMDRCGYPCKLSWSQHEFICVDRAALESCLADLLKDPIIGGYLYALMNLEPQKDGTETAQPEDEQTSLEAVPDEPPEEPSS